MIVYSKGVRRVPGPVPTQILTKIIENILLDEPEGSKIFIIDEYRLVLINEPNVESKTVTLQGDKVEQQP